MGFRTDSYARVWCVDNKGKYSVGSVSISRKNKNTGTYETEFQDGFVRFVGNAHNDINNLGLPTADERKEAQKNNTANMLKSASIKITSCDVTNLYTSPEGKVSFNPKYTIFGFEVHDGNTKGNSNINSATKSGSDDFINVPDDVDDEELPFN